MEDKRGNVGRKRVVSNKASFFIIIIKIKSLSLTTRRTRHEVNKLNYGFEETS